MVEDAWSDALPAAIKWPYTAYKHRLAILGWYKKGLVAIDKGQADIAVLGRQNVGKSTFVACLRGLPSDLEFKKPDRSEKDESAVIFFNKKPYIVRTVPGQDTNTRLNSIEKMFSRANSLKAVIYFADWGYTDIREKTYKTAEINSNGIDTIEKRRLQMLLEEKQDFEDTLQWIRKYVARTRNKIALFLCVGKSDLYMHAIDQAQAYYDPGLPNCFSDAIRKLRYHIGDDVECAASPIVAWPEPFEWNGQPKASIISEDQKRGALKMFSNKFAKLMDRCHG